MIDTMHLYITGLCDHKCPLCCNNFYDMDKIPVATVEELSQVTTVCITGGEPFLVLKDSNHLQMRLRKQFPNIEHLYIYTSGKALADKWFDKNFIGFSGVNIAPKNEKDWNSLQCLEDFTIESLRELKENRLYVFKDQVENLEKHKDLVERLNLNVIYRKWDTEFKTPENEIFRRLPILLGI